jgi:hypothetical protein
MKNFQLRALTTNTKFLALPSQTAPIKTPVNLEEKTENCKEGKKRLKRTIPNKTTWNYWTSVLITAQHCHHY